MPRYYDDWYPRPKPRRPANGIKAQSQRGAFGKTWWAGRWIAALERLVDSARLTRGRSYARSGQVTKLDVGPGGVDARVQGSAARPYRVTIHFTKLADAEWEKVIDAMAAQAIYAARLLSGEMPEQIEEVFQAAGTSLFPAARNDLQTDCSCPDWANPCKHVAAVHYLLGERFDADPFLIFALRGRSKEDIAAALRARRAVGPAVEAASAGPVPVVASETAPALRDTLGAFWAPPAPLPDLALTFQAPARAALPVKRLGVPPFWHSPQDFPPLLEEMYQAIGTHALDLALGTEAD